MGASVLTDGPLGWRVSTMEEAVRASGRLCMCGDRVGEGQVGELFAPSSQFCYKPKTVLKNAKSVQKYK